MLFCRSWIQSLLLFILLKPGSHLWENEFLTEFLMRNCIFPLVWTHFNFSLTISQWYSRVKFSEKNIKTFWYFSHWISQDQRFRLAHHAYTLRNVQKKLMRNQNIKKNDIRRERESDLLWKMGKSNKCNIKKDELLAEEVSVFMTRVFPLTKRKTGKQMPGEL